MRGLREGGGERMEVREKKIKKSRGERGGWEEDEGRGEKGKETKWGQELRGEKEIFKEKGQKETESEGKHAVTP